MFRVAFRPKVSIVFMLVALLASVTLLLQPSQASATASVGNRVSVWLTTANLQEHITQQKDVSFSTGSGSGVIKITVDENKTYQQMDGFGASITDGSAWLIYNKMSKSQRAALMGALFDPVKGIGLNFLRQPMGASDLTTPASGEYSYDDMPKGQTDPTLTHFSIKHDEAYIIPVLKQALQVNPNIKIMATPWSPPGWMKSTDSMEGGTLNFDAYASYANYFVKFIGAYQTQGIPIYAVTVQNEPLYQPVGYPGMSMPADQESFFIKNYLAPAFATNKITTKILGYDHNWDQPGYPTALLSGDLKTNAALAGTAWHCYAGAVEAQTQVHNAYPNKDTYETECSGGQWEGNNGLPGTANLLIGVTRNWGKSVVRWGMALDPNGQPNLGTGAACSQCRGVVTIDQSNGNVTYNGDYDGLGQASKFLTPGAYRIDSSAGSNGIIDSAFKNSDGSKVLVAYNSAASQQSFDVQWGGQWFTYTLPAGAIATFKWSGTQTAGGGSGVVALDRSGWLASASATNQGDSPSNALDGNPATRWSSGQAQAPGMWFQVNMMRPRSFNSISLDAGTSSGDYPHAYQVFVSQDGVDWGNAIASGDSNSQGSGGYVRYDQVTNISFPTQSARFIRVVDTGSGGNWWSLYEFNVYGAPDANPQPLGRSGWSATASVSNVGEPPSNALDGTYGTRWSTGQPQSPGISFRVDMANVQSFSSIALDCGASGGDYPRGYQVFVSNDGSTWGNAIASGQGSSGYTVIPFTKQSARYIKVVLTASSGSWWSIDEFYAFS